MPRNPSASRIDPAEDESIRSDYSDADFIIPSLKWKMKHPDGDREYEAVPDDETGDDDASEEEDFDDVQEPGNIAQYVSGVRPSIEEDPELLALDQRVLGLEATKAQAKAIQQQ